MDYSEEQFDGLFINVLQNAKGIDNFFDCMFSFFRRKTDFFANTDEAGKKVQDKFLKHKTKFLADKEREEKRKLKEEQLKKEDLKRLIPSVKEISAEEAEKLKKQEQMDENKPSISSQVKTETKIEKNSQSEEEKKEEYKGEKPSVLNGGSAPRYTWTQKLEDMQMSIPVEEKFKGKDITIKYKAKTLFVGIKNGETIIDGEFPFPIKPDTFVWVLESSSITNTKLINITFEKFDAMKWWDCAIKGDPVIDTQKINPEPSKLSDLDPEMRKTVDKMMFDQRQKEMGKPVSDDLEKHEMLQKFMKQHPDMDFSKAKFG